MKLKLTGLLLLSQSAHALTIDKNNYKQHLCDDRLFSSVSIVSESTSSYLEQLNRGQIQSDHAYYCMVRNYYEEAVENKRTGTWRTHKPCGGNQKDLIEPAKCMETQGILYAQACEKLKQDRDSMANSWNSIVANPVTCNNM